MSVDVRRLSDWVMQSIVLSFATFSPCGGGMTKRLENRDLASDALVALRRRPRRFTLPNGATVQIPKTAVDGLIQMLEAVAEGDNAIVVRTPREVSTQQAASVLNVSRPTVVKLIDDGVLPSRKVGSHRRITLADLLAYRDDVVTRRRAVLDQMSRDAEELGLYD
jgi:excisionase family DNA binding protein